MVRQFHVTVVTVAGAWGPAGPVLYRKSAALSAGRERHSKSQCMFVNDTNVTDKGASGLAGAPLTG